MQLVSAVIVAVRSYIYSVLHHTICDRMVKGEWKDCSCIRMYMRMMSMYICS